MAALPDIRVVLTNLCDYYRDKNNQPRELSELQIAVYLDGLAEFSADALETAARVWMRKSRWFPALSDLRALLEEPEPNWTELAHVAWTTFERAIGRAGIYSGVTFEDPAIGEAVRQAFGSWEHACSYDRDSPGWAIRRQTFLAVFPSVARKATTPVTLRGISRYDKPLLIAHVEGFPEPARLLEEPDRSPDVLREVTRRFQALTMGKSNGAA
jgi:hypothetical protein